MHGQNSTRSNLIFLNPTEHSILLSIMASGTKISLSDHTNLTNYEILHVSVLACFLC